MSGLIKENLYEELCTEISWLKRCLVELSEKAGVNTYTVAVLRSYMEPEEVQSIERVLVRNYKQLDSLSFAELREKIAKDFFESTGKEWLCESDETLQELIELKLSLIHI